MAGKPNKTFGGGTKGKVTGVAPLPKTGKKGAKGMPLANVGAGPLPGTPAPILPRRRGY